MIKLLWETKNVLKMRLKNETQLADRGTPNLRTEKIAPYSRTELRSKYPTYMRVQLLELTHVSILPSPN